jgi:hypothetical protein
LHQLTAIIAFDDHEQRVTLTKGCAIRSIADLNAIRAPAAGCYDDTRPFASGRSDLAASCDHRSG